MKNKNSAILMIVGVAIAGGAIGYIFSGPANPPAAPAPVPPALDARASAPVRPEPPAPRVVEGSSPAAEPIEPVTSVPPRIAITTPADETPAEGPAGKKAAKAKKPRREPKDPLSRTALVHVGASPVATSYWLAAINNRDLPAEERSDLIEDLNEEGISDPDNPSREDLPLIVSRLGLIANYAPFAMDNVNAAAFAEANKDLLIMYNRLMP